ADVLLLRAVPDFNRAMTKWSATAFGALVFSGLAFSQTTPRPAVDQLIPWVLDEQAQLRGIPFSEVIADVSGKKVIAFDPKNEIDQRVVKAIASACDETMKRLNGPNSSIQSVARINEVSSHFEDA